MRARLILLTVIVTSIAAAGLVAAGTDLRRGTPDRTTASGAPGVQYAVTVTNLTKGQTFTPLLVVSHMPSIELFQPGTTASDELATVAESGNIMPLEALLGTLAQVRDTNTNGGLLGPGETTTVVVAAGGPFKRISLAGMLIPTNDTFVGLRSLALPAAGRTTSAYALAYDAGSEANDQDCANIPGPICMGQGASDPADDDEGFIHVSNGFHDLGDGALDPFEYDWRNPVARVTVERLTGGSSDDEDDDEDEDDD